MDGNLRNQNIYIIQTGAYSPETGNSVNDYIFELLSIIDACKRSMSKSIWF